MLETSIYVLCGLMSVICAALLFRGYRLVRTRLLLWGSLAFVCLALNNVVLVIDLVVLPYVDFGGQLIRNFCGAVAGSLLLFGLIWELI